MRSHLDHATIAVTVDAERAEAADLERQAARLLRRKRPMRRAPRLSSALGLVTLGAVVALAFGLRHEGAQPDQQTTNRWAAQAKETGAGDPIAPPSAQFEAAALAVEAGGPAQSGPVQDSAIGKAAESVALIKTAALQPSIQASAAIEIPAPSTFSREVAPSRGTELGEQPITADKGSEIAKGASPTTQRQAPKRVAGESVSPGSSSTIEAGRLLTLARSRIQQGDIAGARRLLERAAASNDKDATLALAETFDPVVLKRWGVVGVKADPELARTLYRQAARGSGTEPAAAYRSAVREERVE
jgi:TPR repeat protein